MARLRDTRVASLTWGVYVLLTAIAQQASAQQPRQSFGPAVVMDATPSAGFPLYTKSGVTPVCVSEDEPAPVKTAVTAFRSDIQRLSQRSAPTVAQDTCSATKQMIIVGSFGHSELLNKLVRQHRLNTTEIEGKWESALVQVVERPMPGVESALVIAGSDARGAAFAVYDLSRAIGISPWSWWADVPVPHHESAFVVQPRYVQGEPAVKYRGIFLNDEDWGLRPWAAQKMDPALNNIGPNTYARIFELLLRLHANTLWPAMHPGSLPFHMVPENVRLAEQWGVVMGSSHSEALLRDNVGEWDEGRDGPWNYQTNRAAIVRYWDDSAKANGRFENIYTVGMRGQHDSGLEATGSAEVKARLIEQVIADQRNILAHRVDSKLSNIPQVLWLYKESIDLYRSGMRVPDDVTLGWTDDNYGYLRQLPNSAEQTRSGGSALYYHVSYWGAPHDYLWLSSTPPALMREELTKAWDHGVRKVWVLNVGDLKPAEQAIDYFLQLAWRLPDLRDTAQTEFQQRWFAENFPPMLSARMAAIEEAYLHLNFVRKPEFMGFNGYTDEVRRTGFNPLAWGDQNRQRLDAWNTLEMQAKALASELPASYQDAYFELVLYPVAASAAQNRKFLWTDRSFVDQHARDFQAAARDAGQAKAAFDSILELTAKYSQLAGSKWDRMMSWRPRDRRVFEMPETALALATAPEQLPALWTGGAVEPGLDPPTGAQASTPTGYVERFRTVSIDAAHFVKKTETTGQHWQWWSDLGLSNGSIGIAQPGVTAKAAWVKNIKPAPASEIVKAPSLTYEFAVVKGGNATATVALLPTFPVDSEHRLRYALALDNGAPTLLDAAGSEEHRPGLTDWGSNVLRNAALQTSALGQLGPGRHTLTLYYGDPGVLFQNISIRFLHSPEAYPFAPETVQPVGSVTHNK